GGGPGAGGGEFGADVAEALLGLGEGGAQTFGVRDGLAGGVVGGGPGLVPAGCPGAPDLVAVGGDHEVGEVGVDRPDAGEELLAADLAGALEAGLGGGAEGAAVGGGVAGVDGVQGRLELGRVVVGGGADGVAEGVEVGGGAADPEALQRVAEGRHVAVPLVGVAQGDG